MGLGAAGAFSHTNRSEAVVCFRGIVGVFVHYLLSLIWLCCLGGRGIDMGCCHIDFYL